MVFGIADNGDADAKAIGDGAFRDGFGGVVGALGVDVGAKFSEEFFDVGFGEDHDIVDIAKSSDEEGTGVFIEDRAARTFEGTDAGIGIDADDEDVPFGLCAGEIADVADVERVKAAIGENDRFTMALLSGQTFTEKFAGDDFGRGGTHGFLWVGT